jgi:cytochrome o ubiquinol oxidase subunit 2
MTKKPVGFMLLFSGFLVLAFLLMQPLEVYRFRDYIAVLFPKGIVGIEQRNLLLIIQAIMLLVVIPVYILTFIFSWVFREHNKKAVYDPDLVDNRLAEYIWWGLPLVLTAVVSVITYYKTYELDPFKPLAAAKPPITIQAVALQWKWLFIYPEEQIASVNFVQFPKQTPIRFEITADAPMNSLWIPHLGGQIYAMPKMRTELNLIADEAGEFPGSSANLSGAGFSGMNFIAKASLDDEYQEWIEQVKRQGKPLNWEEYEKLALPSENNPVEIFQLQAPRLFNQIIMKYMHPKSQPHVR